MGRIRGNDYGIVSCIIIWLYLPVRVVIQYRYFLNPDPLNAYELRTLVFWKWEPACLSAYVQLAGQYQSLVHGTARSTWLNPWQVW